MQLLVAIFIFATVAWTIASTYLSLRQSTFVQDHRDSVPGDFATTVTPDEHRRAAEYTLAGERITRFKTITEAALSVAWACGGINLLYGTLVATIPQSLTRSVAFLIATGIVGTIVSLPFRIYRTFSLEKRFGFNRTTPLTFIADTIKRAVLAFTIAVPLLYIILWIMQSAARLWWLYSWVGLVILIILAPPVYVRLIAPRFNRFEPLADRYLRNRIERLLAHSGFRASGLFTMDASRRTAHGNAYFTGFGKSKRIVLFDTLLKRSPPEEVEAIVAHELGHFKYHHVLFGLARSAVILFAALGLFGWVAKQHWLLPSFGVDYRDDALALFVCMLLASLVEPLAGLLSNWISRRNEYEADDYAGRMVGVEPLVSALTRLARDNASTLTPDPWHALVHYSHPPVALRVRNLRDTQMGRRKP